MKRLERRAKRFPRLYRFGVVTRALFGYAFFYLLLLASLAALAGGIWLWSAHKDSVAVAAVLIAAGVYGAYFVIRAISFRLEPPTGVVIAREDAPALWQLVDELRARIGRPRVDRILITSDLSAFALHFPARWLLARSRNYLAVGLPLMLALTHEQFVSVIAHELAHLARRHGRVSTWIYRVNQTWSRVLEQTAHRPKHPLARFIRWYAPRFAAHSFVLRREQEFEADRLAAEATNVETAGDALVLAYLRSAAERDLWEKLWLRCAIEPTPPADLMAVVEQRFASLPEEKELRRDLSASLAHRTEMDDSHPSLADRLDGLGYLKLRDVAIDTLRGDPVEVASRMPLPGFASPSAGRALLGDRFAAIAAATTERWAIDVSENWRRRHHKLLRDRGRLVLLERKADTDKLTKEEAFERITINSSLHGKESLPPLFESARAIDESFAPTLYMQGRHLLLEHNAAGIPSLERAMELDPEAVTPGSQLLDQFFREQNQHDRAGEIIRKMDEHLKRVDFANAERSSMNSDERFDPHGWPRAHVQHLMGILQTLPMVERAYLVKRSPKNFPQTELRSLIVFVPSYYWPPKQRNTAAIVMHEIGTRLDLSESMNTFVLWPDNNAKALRDRFLRSGVHLMYV